MLDIHDARAIAGHNLFLLRQQLYIGRGITAGTDEVGNLVQVFMLSGRSPQSRNRMLQHERGDIATQVADPSKPLDDARTLIYKVMRRHENHYVVGNGEHTSIIARAAHSMNPLVLDYTLAGQRHEPDKHATPRIAAIHTRLGANPPRSLLQMTILRRSMLGDSCDSASYTFENVMPGFGYFLSTYWDGDGDISPSFRKEPLLVPLCGTAENILGTFWRVLNPVYRIGVAVRAIDARTGTAKFLVKNEFETADQAA